MTWTKLHDLCGKGSNSPFRNMAIIKQCLAHPEEVGKSADEDPSEMYTCSCTYVRIIVSLCIQHL